MSTENYHGGGVNPEPYALPGGDAPLRAFNLVDGYDNPWLDDAGQLKLAPYMRGPAFVEIGSDILEVSRIPMPHAEDDPEGAKNAFIIRNNSAGDPGAAVVLSDGALTGGHNLGEYEITGRESLVVGSAPDATPELQLSNGVGARHLALRIGGLSRSLVLMDLGSGGNTVVHADPHDTMGHAERTWVRVPGPEIIRAKASIEQRWRRPL